MSCININEIQIYDDKIEEFDIIKKIITTRDEEDAFYILDLGIIIKKHQDWIQKMPRVVPYYGKISTINFFLLFNVTRSLL